MDAQPFVSVKGSTITLNDKPFQLKGTNLGNWLVPEGYMFKFSHATSPRMINEVLDELIGPADTKRFWNNYLHSYITEADIHYLRSTGMNSIRVPFNYRLFTDDDYMGEKNPDHGFQLLDKLLRE